MNNPLISVLMPVYNVEKYIAESIESILKQTFSDFEFLIIDDGSTDNTLSVIQKYQRSDNRIRVIHNEKNIGLTRSLNIGLKEVKGKFLARMDGDDISLPQRFEKQFKFLGQHPEIDVCGTYMRLFGKRDGYWRTHLHHEEIKTGLIWNSAISHATVLMRLDIFKKNGIMYDESIPIAEDWLLWFKIKDLVRFANIPEELYLCRKGDENVTAQHSADSRERIEKLHCLFLNEIGITYSDYELKFHRFILAQFSLTPTPQIIRDARAWMNKLIKHNQHVKVYSVDSFEKIAEEHWGKLFYHLPPYGFEVMRSYYKVSKNISIAKVYYYFRYLVSFKTSHR